MKKNNVTKNQNWISRGKTIKELISELQSFNDQNLEVKISIDDGKSFKCISIVEKENGDGIYFCGLTNCEQDNANQSDNSCNLKKL